MPKKGYKQTLEHRKNLKKACKDNKNTLGKHWKLSIKTKQKMSKAKKDKNHPMFEKHHTKKSKIKMSKKLKGRVAWNKNKKNPEHSERMKLNNPMKGKNWTKKMKNKRKRTKDRHHIDMNHFNNKESNILRFYLGAHNSLHRKAYEYILEKFGVKEIKKYIKWWSKKHKRRF